MEYKRHCNDLFLTCNAEMQNSFLNFCLLMCHQVVDLNSFGEGRVAVMNDKFEQLMRNIKIFVFSGRL